MKILKKIVKSILKYINIVIPRRINGQNVKIPVIQSLGSANILISEFWMIELFKSLDLGGGKFLDIGANIGQTLLKIKSVYKDIEYVGIEPNPINCFYLNRLIKINGINKATIIPVALSNNDELKQLHFYSKSDTDGSASLISNFRDKDLILRSEFVPTFTSKTMMKTINLANIKAIKIDVEGGELEVLETLNELIVIERPFIFIEILPVYSKENEERYNRQLAIEKFVKDWDYEILRVLKKGKYLQSLEQITSIGVHSDLKKSDYLFRPII